MAGAREHLEHAEHTQHISQTSRKIALLISVIALFLAFSETLGKSAQTSAISYNVAANDLWAFFQAKTIRTTVLRTSAERLQLDAAATTDEAARARMLRATDDWNRTAARYDDEASTNEGRKQLMARAQDADRKRENALARYHQYEIASAAFQVGIVLASAAVITGTIALAWAAGLLGVAGLGFTAIGLWAPHAVHLF